MNNRTTPKRAAAYSALVLLCAAVGVSAQSGPDYGAQGGAGGAPSGINSQPGAPPPSHPGIANQGGDDATLEISPQMGIRPPAGDSSEIPSNRQFRPGDDTASTDRRFENNTSTGTSSKSCLGIHVNYTSYCFKGGEEHGLEIVSVDRNSPAERAGLKANGGQAGVIAAAETAGAIIPGLQMLTNHFLEQAAQGDRGDLIVAVDDQRVRSQADFDDAMAKARPGDIMYITVIRPEPGGDHKTMKIVINVGNWRPGDADSCGQVAAAGRPGSP